MFGQFPLGPFVLWFVSITRLDTLLAGLSTLTVGYPQSISVPYLSGWMIHDSTIPVT